VLKTKGQLWSGAVLVADLHEADLDVASQQQWTVKVTMTRRETTLAERFLMRLELDENTLCGNVVVVGEQLLKGVSELWQETPAQTV
jgi:hypothetical protein